MEQFLTKSDFKVARDCPAKLYYKKRDYPATTDGDPHLEQLKKIGYLVEKLGVVDRHRGDPHNTAVAAGALVGAAGAARNPGFVNPAVHRACAPFG